MLKKSMLFLLIVTPFNFVHGIDQQNRQEQFCIICQNNQIKQQKGWLTPTFAFASLCAIVCAAFIADKEARESTQLALTITGLGGIVTTGIVEFFNIAIPEHSQNNNNMPKPLKNIENTDGCPKNISTLK